MTSPDVTMFTHDITPPIISNYCILHWANKINKNINKINNNISTTILNNYNFIQTDRIITYSCHNF